MAAQFDVFRTTSDRLVVVLQSDLLSELRTRAVALLTQDRPSAESMGHLTPIVQLDGKSYTVEGHTVATLNLSELHTHVGTLAPQRDKIIRAVDALLGGI